MSKTTISVVVPVYNGRRFLREAVESVIAQTSPPLELIVVDDGSTDDSLSVLDNLDVPFPIVRLRQENSGQSAARNRGARIAKGDCIALLDQDDIWYPEHLEELGNRFAKKKRIGWIYSDLDEIDEQGLMVRIGVLKDIPVHNPKTNLGEMLGYDMHILPSATLIDREVFLKVGGFDEHLSGYEDDDLFIRIFRAGYRNIYVDVPLSQWRLYSSSSSYTRRMVESCRYFSAKLMQQFPDDPYTQRYWTRDCIAPRFLGNILIYYRRALTKGDYEVCREYVKYAHEYASMMIIGRKQVFKLKLMANPRLYGRASGIVSRLPHVLRRLLSFIN